MRTTEPTYYVGLQDDENEYVATCGCVLTRDGETRQDDACDVAWFVCPIHEHAEDAVQRLRDLVDAIDGGHSMHSALAAARTVLGNIKGDA